MLVEPSGSLETKIILPIEPKGQDPYLIAKKSHGLEPESRLFIARGLATSLGNLFTV